MATKNRTESDLVIDAWTATLDLELTHKPDLKELITNLRFRKDAKNSVIATVSNNTIDFDDYDQVALDLATNNLDGTILASNLDDGDVKYLLVTKDSGKTLAFSGITDISLNQNYTTETLVVFEIINKNSVVYARNMNTSIPEATQNEQAAGTSSSVILTPASQSYLVKTYDIGAWDMFTHKDITISLGETLDLRKILSITILIINDAETILQDFLEGGKYDFKVDEVDVSVNVGGAFDSSDFDGTGINRGQITIIYDNT